MKQSLKIGITDCGKFDNYRRWMEAVPGVETVKLSMHLQNPGEVAACNGIIFSGGEDLQPGLYGKPEYETEFGLSDILPARDHFEFQVAEKAFGGKKPVLGICRGLQLINVYLGGSLVPDIPSRLHSSSHGKIGGTDQVHDIQVEPGTLLRQIVGKDSGEVNSAHHQSVENPALTLRISAFSVPSVVEAMEWADPGNHSWLLTVQWHPERMADLSSPFSSALRNNFLEACTMHSAGY